MEKEPKVLNNKQGYSNKGNLGYSKKESFVKDDIFFSMIFTYGMDRFLEYVIDPFSKEVKYFLNNDSNFSLWNILSFIVSKCSTIYINLFSDCHYIIIIILLYISYTINSVSENCNI